MTGGDSLKPSGIRKAGRGRASRAAIPLLLLCALSACGGGQHAYTGGGATYGYTPPGPPEDPWGPYIHEAANRFSVPERWVRAVMHQESGGQAYLNGQPITSDAGAAGLMQVMPATYAELRDRYNLGNDPYNPHDNIMAGTAYIREMYDKYGSPAFLAAYNAGPQRVDDYMAGRSGLPNETVNYLAAITPHLGNDVPMSGPLAVYADAGGAPLAPDPVPQAYATAPIARCWRDPDAAYDPDAPCRAAPRQRVAAYRPPLPPSVPAGTCWHDPNAAYDPSAPCQTPPPPVQVAAAAPPNATPPAGGCWHDPNAAYDPAAPCQSPPPVQVAEARPAESGPAAGATRCWRDPNAAYDPGAPCQAPPPLQVASAAPPPAPTAPGRTLWGSVAAAPPPPSHHGLASYLIPQAAAAEVPAPRVSGAWSIQVGAFGSPDQARTMAASARGLAPRELSGTRTVVGLTSPFGGHVLYRARLAGLSAQTAAIACSALSAQRLACLTVPPGG
jgi:hypothetical protein